MKFKIGFTGEAFQQLNEDTSSPAPAATLPRKSVVQIRFPGRGIPLAYYNDRFDLRVGDFVYVEGKLEGQRGCVTAVNYNFKIKRSDYKRVIALVDTSVKGQFHYAGSHFVTFDRHALPPQQIISWFKAPSGDDDELIQSSDDSSFRLDDLKTMPIDPAAAERGHGYYMENKVVYLCLADTRGYAIVEGSRTYEVEFEYRNGEISRLTCSCFCSCSCKHNFAAMLQLRETLEKISQSYSVEYANSNYFAAVFRGTLFSFAFDGKGPGSFTLHG